MNYYPVQEETRSNTQSQSLDTYRMNLQTCNNNINEIFTECRKYLHFNEKNHSLRKKIKKYF